MHSMYAVYICYIQDSYRHTPKGNRMKTIHFGGKALIMRAECVLNLTQFSQYNAQYQTMNLRAVTLHLNAINS
jgi:hypothetical protein